MPRYRFLVVFFAIYLTEVSWGRSCRGVPPHNLWMKQGAESKGWAIRLGGKVS